MRHERRPRPALPEARPPPRSPSGNGRVGQGAVMNDLLDPLLDSRLKGFPHTHDAVRRSEIGGLGWNVLAGGLPLPIALIKRDALEHNLAWMQGQARGWKIDLAPHGKTTMSPQLFKRQLDAGAWGLTFATVKQLRVGVAAGARHTLIANQVVDGV